MDRDSYSQLRKKVEAANDKELDAGLEEIWEEADPSVRMDEEIKCEVYSFLHQRIAGRRNRRDKIVRWMKIASVVILPVALFFAFYFQQPSNHPAVEYLVSTEKGEKAQIVLLDGTRVWLNSGSKLTYGPDFGLKNRKVTLRGEAFFQVTKKDKEKFTVEVGGIDIVVYGTEFNVRNYERDRGINVSLIKGKVILQKREGHSLLAEMFPRQSCLVDKENLSYSFQDRDAGMNELWRWHILKFENTPAEQVLDDLGHWYGVNIHVKGLDKSLKYGLTLKYESLTEALNLINKVTPIDYKIEGKEVYVDY